MVDWEGNLPENPSRTQMLLSEIEEDQMMAECMALGTRR